ncbi:MAG: VCBS domain-containing protein, partial [Proteobacteria bacterium]|nr:VCBS domain-containing protein [Pseudomonadota bacterium]
VRPDHTWTYSVDNGLKPVQALNDGQTLVDRVTVLSADGTPHEIQVIIHGADEAPVVVPHPATITSTLGHVYEDRDADARDQLVAGGALHVSDPDRGEAHMPHQVVDGAYGRFEVENDHSWRYVADNDQRAIQALHDGDRLVDRAVVHSADGTAHELRVMIHGTDDGAVIRSTQGYAVEDRDVDRGGRLTASGTITVSDPDAGENHVVADQGMGRYGEFTVNADGTWSYKADNAQRAIQSLDDGDTLTDRFTVHSTDGTAHEIRVTIAGRDEVGNHWWGPAPHAHEEPEPPAAAPPSGADPADPYRAVVPDTAHDTAPPPSDHPVAEYLASVGVSPDTIPPAEPSPGDLSGLPAGGGSGATDASHDASQDGPHDGLADAAFTSAPSALPPEPPPDPEHHQG